jgi:hypothetical protein
MARRRPYEELRSGIEQLGGSMIHKRAGYPFGGGVWIVTLKDKQAVFETEGRECGYSDLNALYLPKGPPMNSWTEPLTSLSPGFPR